MLKLINHLKGFSIRATDGDIGSAEELYFDDLTWTVRYLTVDTGRWLEGRRVLVSPFSIKRVDWPARRVEISLTRQQVEESPDINTRQPVSRQHESDYLSAFGYPNYWAGPYEWGPSYYPLAFPILEIESVEGRAVKARLQPKDSHLRSTGAISGYDIQATDGEIGHVSSFVLDDETWSIRYVEVATRHWWPGKKILISPTWVQRVSWTSSKLYVSLTREAIQKSPAYIEAVPITRDYEEILYSHYGRTPYWQTQIAEATLAGLETSMEKAAT